MFDFFKQNTEYKGEYYRQHPTIRLFWEVFHELTIQLKKRFLCKCYRKEGIKISMSVIPVYLFWRELIHLQSDALSIRCSTSQMLYIWATISVISSNMSLKDFSNSEYLILNHLNLHSCKLFNIVLYSLYMYRLYLLLWEIDHFEVWTYRYMYIHNNALG